MFVLLRLFLCGWLVRCFDTGNEIGLTSIGMSVHKLMGHHIRLLGPSVLLGGDPKDKSLLKLYILSVPTINIAY